MQYVFLTLARTLIYLIGTRNKQKRYIIVVSKRTRVKRFRNHNLSDSFSSTHRPSFSWPI